MHAPRRRLGFWLVILMAQSAPAQFTRVDSLRGYLFPERSCYDVIYYDMDIAIDPSRKSLHGSVGMTYRVVEEFNRMQIDLYDNWEVHSITQDNRQLSFTREGNALFVEFDEYFVPGNVKTITTTYSGQPREAENAPWDGGFVWSQDEYGSPWIGVACEGEGASLWWPCKDHLSDEPDSVQIRVTVPNGLMAVCNGRLRKTELDDLHSSYTWFVGNPINTYNVTVNIAGYVHFSDTFSGVNGALSLDYFVLRRNLIKAQKQFEQVKPMLECFEKYFGPYPFYEDGYKLIETPYLGMEHQSAIAYGNRYQAGYQGMDLSGTGFDYIIIHESGHEWFGNSISAADLAELWIHESFTTYAEAIYIECLYGYWEARKYLRAQRSNISNKRPIVGPRGVACNSLEETDMYYKGAWMLHSLRGTVNNDTLWFDVLLDFCQTFYHRITNTEEVIRFFCDRSGMNLEPIFRHYLYSPKQPMFEYKLKRKRDEVEVSYRWADVASDFNMPVEVGYSYSSVQLHRLYPTTTWQSLTMPSSQIEGIIVDAGKFYVKQKKL